jgi:hypothetical protein
MALQSRVDSLQQWQADVPPHALMARRRRRGTVVIDKACWKRNKKVASTSRLRMLPGASLDMAWVVGLAYQPHPVEEGEKTGECTTGLHSNLFVTLPGGMAGRASTSV